MPYSFCRNQQGFTESRTGSSTSHNHCSSLDHSNLISSPVSHVSRISSSSTILPSVTDPPNRPPEATFSSQQVKVNGMQIVRDSLRARGVQRRLQQLPSTQEEKPLNSNTMSLARSSTIFALKGSLDPCSISPVKALDFLTDLFEQGLGYSALNTARFAMSQVLQSQAGISFGELSLTTQFIERGFSTETISSTVHGYMGSGFVTELLKDSISKRWLLREWLCSLSCQLRGYKLFICYN